MMGRGCSGVGVLVVILAYANFSIGFELLEINDWFCLFFCLKVLCGLIKLKIKNNYNLFSLIEYIT